MSVSVNISKIYEKLRFFYQTGISTVIPPGKNVLDTATILDHMWGGG